VGGLEQSEIWDTFRVARMARVLGAWPAPGNGGGYGFRGAYSPYFDRRIRHEREFRFANGRLVVRDEVSGAAGAPLASYLHFHPRLRVRERNGHVLVLEDPSGNAVRVSWQGVDEVLVGRGEGTPEGWYLPKFGNAEPAVAMMGVGPAGRGTGYEILHLPGR
jgi:hypothetical protein